MDLDSWPVKPNSWQQQQQARHCRVLVVVWANECAAATSAAPRSWCLSAAHTPNNRTHITQSERTQRGWTDEGAGAFCFHNQWTPSRNAAVVCNKSQTKRLGAVFALFECPFDGRLRFAIAWQYTWHESALVLNMVELGIASQRSRRDVTLCSNSG